MKLRGTSKSPCNFCDRKALAAFNFGSPNLIVAVVTFCLLVPGSALPSFGGRREPDRSAQIGTTGASPSAASQGVDRERHSFVLLSGLQLQPFGRKCESVDPPRTAESVKALFAREMHKARARDIGAKVLDFFQTGMVRQEEQPEPEESPTQVSPGVSRPEIVHLAPALNATNASLLLPHAEAAAVEKASVLNALPTTTEASLLTMAQEAALNFKEPPVPDSQPSASELNELHAPGSMLLPPSPVLPAELAAVQLLLTDGDPKPPKADIGPQMGPGVRQRVTFAQAPSKEEAWPDKLPDFKAMLVGLAAAVLLGACCLAAGFYAAFSLLGLSRPARPEPLGERDPSLRDLVEALTVQGPEEVEKLLPAEAGYDCALSRPVSSGCLVRLELKVQGPCAGRTTLTSPLTGKPCVLHFTSVSRRLHAGMPPVPVAFSASNTDFVAVLPGSKHSFIVRGAEVSLFDMIKGRFAQNKSFAASPDHWQDFVLTHRSAAPSDDFMASSSLRLDSSALEFQECALFMGACVTVVGELHRGADGTFALKGFQRDGAAQAIPAGAPWGSAGREPWRTSWEHGGCETGSDGQSMVPSMLLEKVLISDDPRLLHLIHDESKRVCSSGPLLAGLCS